MTHAMTSFPVAELSPPDRYKLIIGLVVPRPIGWIGTYAEDGVANLAPYSFFQAVATNPPVVLFSSGVSEGEVKDSLANVRSSGVFTVNIADHGLSAAMNETAAAVPISVDEFAMTGLTAEKYGTVEAPGVSEAKAVLECKVINEVTFGNDPMLHVVTFGEVVAFHVADDIFDGTRIDGEALDAIGRMAAGYATTRDQFSL